MLRTYVTNTSTHTHIYKFMLDFQLPCCHENKFILIILKSFITFTDSPKKFPYEGMINKASIDCTNRTFT